MDTNLFALLVGIDQYQSPQITQLKGCVNDVAQMRQFLVNQMSVPEANIKTLTNAEATRANLIATFQTFLINNPAIGQNAQILFHYSGHGSQIPSRSLTELDGLDETIVVHDARTYLGGQYVFDIPDKTIAALLEALSATKGDNITVFLDCCHSGSGTRQATDNGASCIRKLEPDVTLPPPDLDAEIRNMTRVERAGTPLVGISGLSVRTRPNHVLIAGCRDMELSHEMTGRDGQQHGALTYFLLDYLSNKTGIASYADLHEQVAAKVNAIFRNQMPVCEGQRDRKLFGGATIQRDPFITVSQVSGNLITLDAGSLLPGLAAGAVLKLYPPNVKEKADLARVASIGTAEVTQTSPISALAKLALDGATPVTARARAVIHQPAYAAIRQKVSFQTAADTSDTSKADQNTIRSLEGELTARGSAYLEIVKHGGDLRVIAKDGKLHVCDAGEEDLISPEDVLVNQSSIMDALEAIARFRALAQMTNLDPRSRVQGALKINLLHHMAGGDSVPLSPQENGNGGIVLIAEKDEYHPRNQYVVEIENQSAVGVYPHLVILNPDFSVVHLYPQGDKQDSQLLAGRKVQCGIDNPIERLRIFLPSDWASSQDRLLLIATTEPANLGTLNQKGLTVPAPTRGVTSSLADFLGDISRGTRMGGNSASELQGVDWGTALLTYRTTRASQTVPLALGQTQVALQNGIQLTKPAALSGEIKIETVSETVSEISNRSTDEAPAATKLPPGLAALSEQFALIGLPSARSSGATGLVFTLTLDDSGRGETVNANQPLTLDLSHLDESLPDDLLPIVFDGEDYLLVPNVSRQNGVVALANLPQPKASLDGIATQRGFLNALKLFVFKKLGHYSPELGLKRAMNVKEGGTVQPGNFKPGDKVVLFVHGFTSDTRWMVNSIALKLQAIGFNYDHILTFDYETFGTGVTDNGKTLADALRSQYGFGADDGVHLDVFAHSMGCLVARCMIEMNGGHEFVDRLVLAGAPNKGTTLATVAKTPVAVAEFLFDTLLNGTIPIAGEVAVKLLKAIGSAGKGFEDIQAEPLSPIVQQLNALPQPTHVPYLILAGIYDASANDAQQARIARIAEKVFHQSLTALFGEPNDLVIGAHSMREVRQQSSPLITVKEITCSHSHYFAVAESFTQLQKWLS